MIALSVCVWCVCVCVCVCVYCVCVLCVCGWCVSERGFRFSFFTLARYVYVIHFPFLFARSRALLLS